MAQLPLGASATALPSEQAGSSRSLIIVTMLFFMWGLLTSLNDVLIPHLKSIYTLSYVQAMLVQFCFFGAYFIVSIPAGALIKRIGYQNGAVTGLIIAATGCALFYPAAESGYALFLFAFFVLASGITILQVAANPYVTVLGDPKTASSRLTLTQAFNSLGTTVGPLFGGILILSGAALATTDVNLLSAHGIDGASRPGSRGGAGSLPDPGRCVAAACDRVRARALAQDHPCRRPASMPLDDESIRSIFHHRNLILGAVAIFLYVGGGGQHRQFPDQLHGREQHRRIAARRRRKIRQLLLGLGDGGSLHRLRGDALRQSRQGARLQCRRFDGPDPDRDPRPAARSPCGPSSASACSTRSCSRPFSAWRCTSSASSPARARAYCAWRSSAARSCRSCRGSWPIISASSSRSTCR